MTLTANEEIGLMQEFGLADGHAYHDLDAHQLAIVTSLPEIWRQASIRKHVEVEREFASAFYTLARQSNRVSDSRFKICTSASQSIDVVARLLSQLRLSVGLIEPTFDNLALLLRRWRVPLVSVNFNDLQKPEALAKGGIGFDVLFLVLPNNPTGEYLTIEEFTEVVIYCKYARKVLVVDFCFRFFAPVSGDFFAIMDDAGIDYICVEDTGKTWPTLDMKASLLVYSDRFAADLEDIYAEVFLCVSPFVLSVLTSFTRAPSVNEGNNVLWALVENRHRCLEAALAGTNFQNLRSNQTSRMPVAWIAINGGRTDDLEVMRVLQKNGVACLPGRYFYWDSHERNGHNRIRVALLKPSKIFNAGVERLREVLTGDFATVR